MLAVVKNFLIFRSVAKYLHVKIASLATVIFYVTINFRDAKCLALYTLHGLPLRLSASTEDTSVSSCGVKLQQVLSGLAKTLDMHVHFCVYLFFFPLGV